MVHVITVDWIERRQLLHDCEFSCDMLYCSIDDGKRTDITQVISIVAQLT